MVSINLSNQIHTAFLHLEILEACDVNVWGPCLKLLQRRRTCRSSCLCSQIHFGQMFSQTWTIHILCEYVCRIICAQDLLQFEIACPDVVLDPQVCHCQVSNLSKSTPFTDSDGS